MTLIEKKRATVIIPARNEGLFLGHTLESMQRTAGYANYRVVVVDDASKDGSAKGLLERFPDMDLEVVRVADNNQHGTGVSRNRGLKVAEADMRDDDVIVTTDAHMVFPQNWLADMMAAHEAHAGAFLMTASCGFRSVADIHLETIINPDDGKIAATIASLRKNFGRPLLVEKAREAIDEKDPGHLQRLMQKFGVCMVYADGPVQKKPVWTFHVKDSIMAPGKPTGVHYGCGLEYDAGDQDFITPKWRKSWDTEHPPMQPIVPVDGFMGATYLFPLKLFLERIGGWPWIAGWVHEEPYLSIAAGIQGIPVLLLRDVITAHSYDRPITIRPNAHGIMLNRQAVTEICFSDMKGPIQREIFGNVIDPVMLERRVGPELRRRREMVQSGRVMSDKEWLYGLGLLHHFDPELKKLMVERLGVTGVETKDASAKGIENMFDGLHRNSKLRWGHASLRMGDGMELRTINFCEDGIFDPETGDRKKGETELPRKEEMQGAVMRDLVGRMAMDWMFSNTIAGRLPIVFQDIELLKENVRAIQQFVGERVASSLNFLIGTAEEHEILLRTIRRIMPQLAGYDPVACDAMLVEEREKLKTEVVAKSAAQDGQKEAKEDGNGKVQEETDRSRGDAAPVGNLE